MTGYPNHNFPAFDAAETVLTKLGYTVINPANLDRAVGIDGSLGLTQEQLVDTIRRDLNSVLDCDVICLLPGWENSLGAMTEKEVARWAGKKIIEYIDLLLSPA